MTTTNTISNIGTLTLPYTSTSTTALPYTALNDITTTYYTVQEKETPKLKFGPIKNDSVRICAKGIAVRNKDNQYTIFNPETHAIEDVTLGAIKTSYIYTIPIALKDVMIGDLIKHQDHYCYVVDGDENTLEVIDMSSNEKRIIYPTQSPFGFNFITKVTSLIDISSICADAPFGDPLMLLALNADNDNLLPLLLYLKK